MDLTHGCGSSLLWGPGRGGCCGVGVDLQTSGRGPAPLAAGTAVPFPPWAAEGSVLTWISGVHSDQAGALVSSCWESSQ